MGLLLKGLVMMELLLEVLVVMELLLEVLVTAKSSPKVLATMELRPEGLSTAFRSLEVLVPSCDKYERDRKVWMEIGVSLLRRDCDEWRLNNCFGNFNARVKSEASFDISV